METAQQHPPEQRRGALLAEDAAQAVVGRAVLPGAVLDLHPQLEQLGGRGDERLRHARRAAGHEVREDGVLVLELPRHRAVHAEHDRVHQGQRGERARHS